MSEGVAPLPPLHARHVRSLTRLLTAREDALVLCIAPVGEVRPRIEAALQSALGEDFELCALELPREGESAWTTMTARATEAREAGRRPVLSVSLRLDDVDEMARVNLGRESRQRERLLVLLWLPGVEAYEEFRVRSPDVWSHRTELKFFLTRDDLAAAAEREGVPEVPMSNADFVRAFTKKTALEHQRILEEADRASAQQGTLGSDHRKTIQIEEDLRRHQDEAASHAEAKRIKDIMQSRGSESAIKAATESLRTFRPSEWPITASAIATTAASAMGRLGRVGDAITVYHDLLEKPAPQAFHPTGLADLSYTTFVAGSILELGRTVDATAYLDKISVLLNTLRRTLEPEELERPLLADATSFSDWCRGRIDWHRGRGEVALLHVQRAMHIQMKLQSGLYLPLLRSWLASVSLELGLTVNAKAFDLGCSTPVFRSYLNGPEWRIDPAFSISEILATTADKDINAGRTLLRTEEKAGTPDKSMVLRDQLCLLCLTQERLDEARRFARTQVQQFRSAQSPLGTAWALVLLGRIEAARSLHHEALARYREATTALEREPPQYRSLFAMRDIAIWRARSEHAIGRTADARATLHTILAELNAQQLRLVTLDVLHDLSVITPPDDPDAERLAEEALSIAQDASALWFEARAMLDLAFVRRSRGTPAQPLITEAEAILDSYGDPITLQQFRDRLPSA